MHTLYLSHRIETLLDRLLVQFEETPIDPLQVRTILVPHSSMKQWLLLEVAKRKGIAMGLEFVEINHFYPLIPRSLELFCSVYRALGECQDPDLQSYLAGKEKRRIDLTEQLVSLFFTYGQYGKELFKGEETGWQQTILKKLFVEGAYRMPVQGGAVFPESLICFGIDYLPPIHWEFLFRASSLSIYLFSPCQEFWEDVYSEREQRSLNRFWKKQRVSSESQTQLEEYLKEAPKILANWGKWGRETLKIFESYDLQVEELYPLLSPTSYLKQIQYDLLHFQETKQEKSDDSVQIFLTGSSRLKEIECLRDEILRLNVPFHEISVLAPNMEPYVPLIEFVFSDLIPYRISGFDLAPQSSFRQGLIRLSFLSSGRWDAEEILTLFETPSFYRKLRWDQEKLETFRSWINAAQIKWGWDGAHRKKTLSQHLGAKDYENLHSWETGLDRLLDSLIYLLPLQINADLFEEFLSVLNALKNFSCCGEKTLAEWAECLEKGAQEFLLPDPEDEADQAAQTAFHQWLRQLRMAPLEGLFPLSVIHRLLLRPISGQIHSSHLHGVRFAPLEEGAFIPATALFLIGMDEESFPRLKSASSLNLLRKEKIPHSADRDRYALLQALFSARDFLKISYCHLSEQEGKPVGPSLLIEELPLQARTVYNPPAPKPKPHFFSWPNICESVLPEGEITLSFSDLKKLAQHPWKFYLQKVRGIYLNEPLATSFALQKSQALRSSLQLPLEEAVAKAKLPEGRFGEALKQEIHEKNCQWQSQLQEWQLHPFTLNEPILLEWDRLKVRLVGEIKGASEKGLICLNDDHIGGLLKVWPEALAVAICRNSPQVWMMKSGKIKNLENPHQSLKSFVEYYFRCLKAPSPLLPDWADSLLRKGLAEWEKSMQKGAAFEDPVLDWVTPRIESKPSSEIFEIWGPYLKETFASLISLYPRKNHGSV